MSRTALARYALLEAVGVYTDSRAARPTEVVAKFGELSLTLYDLEEQPIAHWALASLRGERDGPGTLMLRPGEGSEERLALTDPELIEALHLVCPDLERRLPARGRLRRMIWAGAGLAVAAAALLTLPQLIRLDPSLLPQVKEERLGRAVLAEIRGRLGGAGSPVADCSTPEGEAALALLVRRLAPGMAAIGLTRPVSLHVLDHPALNLVALPGDRILVFRGLLTAAEGPEELAALLAHELAHVAARDPARRALDLAGIGGLIALTLGDGSDSALPVRIAPEMLAPAYAREVEEAAWSRAATLLAAAGRPVAPAKDGAARLAASDTPPVSHLANGFFWPGRLADALTATLPYGTPPVLDDQDWVALQGICER